MTLVMMMTFGMLFDNALIYIADQWTIAQFYTSSPADLVWDDVFSSFEGDIYAICNKIVEAGDEE